MKLTLFTPFLIFVFVLTLLPENSVAGFYTKSHYRYRAKARLGKGTIGGHIVYASNGMMLAASHRIGLWFYDTQTGEEVNILREQTDVVTIVLTDVWPHHVLYVWQANTSELLLVLGLSEVMSDFTNAGFLRPYKQILADAGYAEIRLWNAVKHLNTLLRHPDYSEMTDTLWGGWRGRHGSY